MKTIIPLCESGVFNEAGQIIAQKFAPSEDGYDIVGIDPSQSCTSLCFLKQGKYLILVDIPTKPSVKHKIPEMDHIQAQEYIANAIIYWLDQFKPKHVMLEDYAIGGSFGGSTIVSVELGGIIRWILSKYPAEQIDKIDPTSLKKFVTGVGTGNKAIMVSTLASKHQIVFENDNQSDALACVEYGVSKFKLGKVSFSRVDKYTHTPAFYK